jgi:hypothetical protein
MHVRKELNLNFSFSRIYFTIFLFPLNNFFTSKFDIFTNDNVVRVSLVPLVPIYCSFVCSRFRYGNGSCTSKHK